MSDKSVKFKDMVDADHECFNSAIKEAELTETKENVFKLKLLTQCYFKNMLKYLPFKDAER